MYKEAKFKKLRRLCAKLWVKSPKKGFLEKFAFPCEHTHTFTYGLKNANWYYKGKLKGVHKGIVLEGCYLCGKIKVRDYEA